MVPWTLCKILTANLALRASSEKGVILCAASPRGKGRLGGPWPRGEKGKVRRKRPLGLGNTGTGQVSEHSSGVEGRHPSTGDHRSSSPMPSKAKLPWTSLALASVLGLPIPRKLTALSLLCNKGRVGSEGSSLPEIPLQTPTFTSPQGKLTESLTMDSRLASGDSWGRGRDVRKRLLLSPGCEQPGGQVLVLNTYKQWWGFHCLLAVGASQGAPHPSAQHLRMEIKALIRAGPLPWESPALPPPSQKAR